MKIEIDKGNKYQLLGAAYKKNLKRISRAITPKEYRDLSEEAGFPTIKYDGEFSIVHWEEGQDPAVYSAGVGGKIRTDITALDYFVSTLTRARIKSITVFAELYGVEDWQSDKPLSFPEFVKLAHDRKGADAKLKLAIFDIAELNGDPVDGDYASRYKLISDLFKTNPFAHPVRSEANWSAVEKSGLEGLMVRGPKYVYKVKASHTFDAVIYAFDKKGKHMARDPPGIGAVHVGFITQGPDGFRNYLVDAGKVGSGWSEEERREVFQKLKLEVFDEDDKKYFVRLKYIIEVAYFEMQPKRKMFAYPIFGEKFDNWFPIIVQANKFRFPKRIHYDGPEGSGDYPQVSDHPKTVTPEDIGVNQVPGLVVDFPKENPPIKKKAGVDRDGKVLTLYTDGQKYYKEAV